MSPAYGGAETRPVGAVVRIATADDDVAIAALRRAWTEERAGLGPIDDPDFEPAFLEWADRERSRRINGASG